MKLNSDQLSELSKTAIEAAREAASLITEFSKKDLQVVKKSGGDSLASQVVTEADNLSQEVILEKLQKSVEKFNLGLLTEESEDNQSRFEKDYFWCIDPLDGTLPFTEKKDGYAVSIALVSKSGVPYIGVVVNPVNKAIYVAVKGEGVYKNGKKITVRSFKSSEDTFTIICDRSFLNQSYYDRSIRYFRNKISEWGLKNINLISIGGAAMNACWVLENAPACYFKFPKKTEGGGSLWDYAATACIFNELGAFVSDIYGESLNLNLKETTFMNESGIIFSTNEKTRESIINLYKNLIL